MACDSPEAGVGVVARPHVYAGVRGSPIALVDRQHLHVIGTTITLRVLGLDEAHRGPAAVSDDYAFIVARCPASVANCLEQLLILRGGKHVSYT